MKTRITYSAICFLALLAATPQQQLVIQPVHSILLLREQSIKLWYNYQVMRSYRRRKLKQLRQIFLWINRTSHSRSFPQLLSIYLTTWRWMSFSLAFENKIFPILLIQHYNRIRLPNYIFILIVVITPIGCSAMSYL